MTRSINSPENLKALLPGFAAGCRRFTPADAYMKALNQPNVQLRTSPITHADHSALYTTEGKRHSYDAIVCATGFDPYTPRFPIIGRAGSDLSALWSKDGGYESYMAAVVAGFPNFFGKSLFSTQIPRNTESVVQSSILLPAPSMDRHIQE